MFKVLDMLAAPLNESFWPWAHVSVFDHGGANVNGLRSRICFPELLFSNIFFHFSTIFRALYSVKMVVIVFRKKKNHDLFYILVLGVKGKAYHVYNGMKILKSHALMDMYGISQTALVNIASVRTFLQ